MKESLDELVQYLRQTLPQSQSLQHLRQNTEADVVTFHWQGREFLVRKSLEVFELKGPKLYVTGASTLMQMVLLKRDRNKKLIESTVKALQEVEEMINSRARRDAGLKLLEAVKSSLSRLASQ